MAKLRIFQNKRAQVSETMTWIVATIIILIILTVSVFLASLMGQSKDFPAQNQFDSFTHKSLIAYLLTKDASGQIVYNEINSNGEFNDFNGNLADKIFTNLYSGYYNRNVFMGILDLNKFFAQLQGNDYFTVPPGETPNSLTTQSSDKSNIVVKDLIFLNNNKAIQMILWHTN